MASLLLPCNYSIYHDETFKETLQLARHHDRSTIQRDANPYGEGLLTLEGIPSKLSALRSRALWEPRARGGFVEKESLPRRCIDAPHALKDKVVL